MGNEDITEVELVFMNGDAVLVDMNAVVDLKLVTDHDEMEWDSSRRIMYTDHYLKSFRISMDITRVQLFRRRFLNALGEGVDSRNADGMAAVQRIREFKDLSSVYVNGQKYIMPNKYAPNTESRENLLQTTAELTTTVGTHQIEIEVIAESDYRKVSVF